MPLLLYYLDSPGLFLKEILDPLIEKHIAFKLQDSFRIITPDQESRGDIEEFLLRDPRLGEVLIGKSILTFAQFWQFFLFSNPSANPLAPPSLERKVLQGIFQTDQGRELDLATLRQYQFELKRLHRLSIFQPLRKTEDRGPLRWASRMRALLTKKFGFWSYEQGLEETWRYLEKSAVPEFKKIREIHFIGFNLVDYSQLRCLRALLNQSKELTVHFYLPPPERIMDPQGLCERVLRDLEHLATAKTRFSPLPKPNRLLFAALTPLHEAEKIHREYLEQAEGAAIICAPQESASFLYLRDALTKSWETAGLPESDAPMVSIMPFKILEELSHQENSEGPVTFLHVYEKLFPLFQSHRMRLIQTRNPTALKFLEDCFQRVREYYQTESYQPEIRPLEAWIKDLQEDFKDWLGSTPAWADFSFALRNLERPGLAPRDSLWLAGLNEGIFPHPTPNFIISDQIQDSLFKHEKKLAFEQCLYLAKNPIQMSYAAFSMAGQALGPSEFLEEVDEDLTHPLQTPLQRSDRSRHPFYEENICREFSRHQGPLGLDQGNLQSLNLRGDILKKIRHRPLSPSYLDDYAKCPWRFFARWHLKLEELPEEQLEMEPKLRGRLAHSLLEKTLGALAQTHFSSKKIPLTEDIQAVLEEGFVSLTRAVEKFSEAKVLHPAVMTDELEKIRDQTARLLEAEMEVLRNSSKKLFPKYFEWRFGKVGGPQVAFPVDKDVSLPLMGVVDRIDLSEDGDHFLIIDYKSSGTYELSRELRDLASYQLFVYLYAVQKYLLKDAAALGGLYWNIKELKKIHGMVLKEDFQPFSSGTLRAPSYFKTEEYQEQNQKLEEALRGSLKKILSGDYGLDPPHCLGWRCQFHEICRYENQPR